MSHSIRLTLALLLAGAATAALAHPGPAPQEVSGNVCANAPEILTTYPSLVPLLVKGNTQACILYVWP